MPTGYRTISVSNELYETLTGISKDVAESEGLSRVSLASLLERMLKVYKDSKDNSAA